MKITIRVVVVGVLALAAWLIAGFAGAQTACAHDPRFSCSPRSLDRAVVVSDPQKSWAFYGRLAPSQSDAYTFEVTKPIRVPVSLLIEQADAPNAPRPSLVVRRSDGRTTTLDFRESTSFHEPFSGLDYLTTPDRRYDFSPGQYTATVTMRGEGSPQRYVFAIGEAERFGVGEIPYVLGAVYRVKTRGF